MTTQNLPVVTIVDGSVTTLSTDVATFFQKQHKDVLRAVGNILETLDEEHQRNFAPTFIFRDNPNGGAPIKSKAYRLTRDGFTFLAMGFTGPQAQAFKWAYIDAFNRMEATLRCPAKDQLPPPMLTEQQAYAIMREVAKRAKNCGAHYQTIYRALKARYQVTKYTHIPREMFDDAVRFIQTVNLSVPETAPQKPAAPKGKHFAVTQTFLERQRDFVYCWRYLYRDELERLIKLMTIMESPHAGMLWDVVHDMNLVQIEEDLGALGFPVKELDCYKNWASHQPA